MIFFCLHKKIDHSWTDLLIPDHTTLFETQIIFGEQHFQIQIYKEWDFPKLLLTWDLLTQNGELSAAFCSDFSQANNVFGYKPQSCKLLLQSGSSCSCPVGLETSSRILKIYSPLFGMSRIFRATLTPFGYFSSFLNQFCPILGIFG